MSVDDERSRLKAMFDNWFPTVVGHVASGMVAPYGKGPVCDDVLATPEEVVDRFFLVVSDAAQFEHSKDSLIEEVSNGPHTHGGKVAVRRSAWEGTRGAN